MQEDHRIIQRERPESDKRDSILEKEVALKLMKWNNALENVVWKWKLLEVRESSYNWYLNTGNLRILVLKGVGYPLPGHKHLGV